VNDSGLEEVLRLSARIDRDPTLDEALARAAAQVDDWQNLPALAETHGLAPLVKHHLTRVGAAVPTAVRQGLLALAFAHQQVNRVKFTVLGEILDALNAAGIRVVVLKGAALAHLLYPDPGMRPLGDLDLLVDADKAARAQSTLALLGFTAPLTGAGTGPRTRRHHHLPIATKPCDGHEVRVEIHTDALTEDTPGSLTTERVSAPLQPFAIGGHRGLAFGHSDMLFHLCRHAAQPAAGGRLRLIWVADIVGYATRYRDDISWPDLRLRYPFVANALSLLDLVTPLPRELAEYAGQGTAAAMRGVGTVSKPPNEILGWRRPVRDIARDVLDPSDWWLRLYYGIGVGSPLWACRWVRHPVHVGLWFARRTRTFIP
jgi:hypothetical protein